ncbi:uncharacterized protein LOC144873579 [Branchiostoma floridae x Branchiostoma japonicum]
MAMQSGWDTIFAEPILWSRKEKMRTCWDHIKYTVVASVSIMVFLWLIQGHRYLYNVMYGPFALSEQEIVDTRRVSLWKQYIQVHHGTTVRRETNVGCGSEKCKIMILQFKKHAAHNSRIHQLVVKRPHSHKHQSHSVRQPIDFSAMSAKKLVAIIHQITSKYNYSVTRYVVPGIEKPELESIISKAYDSNPKKFNVDTESHVLVGFLTDFGVLRMQTKPEFMDLVLDTCGPYFSFFSIPIMCALLYVCSVLMVVYYIFKLAKAWYQVFTSFGSTKFQKRILKTLEHTVLPDELQGNNPLSIYDFAALRLQKEIFNCDVATVVNEEHFRLFVTKKHVIFLRNDVIDVMFVSQIDDIEALPWSDECDVLLSSGQCRNLQIGTHLVCHMRNALNSRSARFRQLEEERTLRRQQEEEERLARLRAEQEVRRRRQEEFEETIRRRRGQEEAINEFLSRLAERDEERPASEKVVEVIRDSAFELNTNSEEDCVICQYGIKKGDMVIPFPCPAKHQFHEDCMLQYLKRGSSCPLCRHQVEQETVDDHAPLDIVQHMFN